MKTRQTHYSTPSVQLAFTQESLIELSKVMAGSRLTRVISLLLVFETAPSVIIWKPRLVSSFQQKQRSRHNHTLISSLAEYFSL